MQPVFDEVKNESYRDQEWLENLLADIWYNYFLDIEQTYEVKIGYGRRARQRLGSIGLDRNNPNISVITINPIYQDLEVPEYVIRATVVHELTHYAHGFNSPHNQRYRHPHSGGVIRREFAERGLEDLYVKQRAWLKQNWSRVVIKHLGLPKPRVRQSPRASIPWWFR